MTVLQIIKSNLLVSLVPGGLQVSFSWALVSLILFSIIIYSFLRKKFKKAN